MTDLPPTNPGDVVITGQRRRSDGTFPSRGGGGGIPGDDGGVHQDELDPDGNPDGPPLDPCSNPASALPFNADAAGAGSVPAFRAKAAELGGADAPNGVPVLTHREFGRALGRSGASVFGNNVRYGDPLAAGATFYEMYMDYTGVGPSSYIGFAHTHPNGDALPSVEDWNEFMRVNELARGEGRTSETFYLYITAVGQNGAPDRTYVYQDGPRPTYSDAPPRPLILGAEVNPDAQPCS